MPTPRGTWARCWSHSTPGRIAAATMKPMKSSAMTSLIFQTASASTTMLTATMVATAARRATLVIARVLPRLVEAWNPMEERIYLHERRHGIVLVRPLVRALALAAVGAGGGALRWPATPPGLFLLVGGAGG